MVNIIRKEDGTMEMVNDLKVEAAVTTKVVTEEEMIEIFKQESFAKWEGDNAFQGLVILSKYTKNLIHGADHDIIYSESTDKLIKAGITREDCVALRNLNWMISDYSLACYV